MALDKLFNQLLASPGAQGALGGAASGALVSALMNKKARKTLVNGAATVGGMAALAGVGYYAYRKWQQHQAGKAATVPPAASRPSAGPTEEAPLEAAVISCPPVDDRLGLKMLQAMIAAAHADGAVEERELQQVFEALNRAGLTPEENASLTAALDRPPTVEAIATGVSQPEQAAEIYGAAVLVVERATPAEQFFLQRLAHQLRLPAALRQQIHETLLQPAPPLIS